MCYAIEMNERSVRKLVELARSWSKEDRRGLIAYAEAIEAKRREGYRISTAERAALTEALAEADRGEFVGDAALAAAEARHGL